MWGMVVLLALIAAPEPWRIGTAALLISRPRPMQNLLAFCLGGIALCTLVGVAVLFVLRDFAITLSQGAADMTASSTFGHIRIGLGVLALVVAALVATGFSVRRRAQVTVPGDPSAVLLEPTTRTGLSRVTTRVQEVLTGGSPWLAFVAGAGMSTTPLEYPVALATILASGAAAGTQINAVVMYGVVTFVIVEIPLVAYLAAPARTQAVMLQLNSWLATRRTKILAVMVGAIGVVLVATGVGGL